LLASWGRAALVVGFLIWSSPAVIDLPGGQTITAEMGAGFRYSNEDAEGVLYVIANRQQEGSSATIYSDARQALISITAPSARFISREKLEPA
jgi:hypothetical protein